MRGWTRSASCNLPVWLGSSGTFPCVHQASLLVIKSLVSSNAPPVCGIRVGIVSCDFVSGYGICGRIARMDQSLPIKGLGSTVLGRWLLTEPLIRARLSPYPAVWKKTLYYLNARQTGRFIAQKKIFLWKSFAGRVGGRCEKRGPFIAPQR